VSRTPEETFRRLLELLPAKDMDAIADLWAEHGTAEFPFAVAASSRELVGREVIRGYLAGYADRLDVQEIERASVHHTDRSDTVIVEFTASGRTVRTGEPYRLDYITVVTTEDGLITRYRDYWSPVAVAAATGTLPDLLVELGTETDR